MTRFKEQRLYDAMRREAPRGAWLQRVENMVGAGMPDVLVTGHGRSAWVELKSVHRPARATTRWMGDEGLRDPDQINWHLKFATYGLTSWVLANDDRGALLLLDGMHADQMNSWPLEAAQNHATASGSWVEIFEEILR